MTSKIGKLRNAAKEVYNYHNLGVGIFPKGEEKTPCGSGERYNFDRMYMMASNYDFTGKNILDLGCNSGWFCLQGKLLGTGVTVGVDHAAKGIMGQAIFYAMELEKRLRFDMTFVNADIEKLDLIALARKNGIEKFDAVLLLSVLHHIQNKQGLMEAIYEATRDVVFYEDHEFWNRILDPKGEPVAVKGEGYRFGWNEDMGWQRRMSSLEVHEPLVLEHYRSTWRKEVLLLDKFKSVRLLGFSEKRRPLLALWK